MLDNNGLERTRRVGFSPRRSTLRYAGTIVVGRPGAPSVPTRCYAALSLAQVQAGLAVLAVAWTSYVLVSIVASGGRQ